MLHIYIYIYIYDISTLRVNDFFKLILYLFIEALSASWDRLMSYRMGVDYLADVWQ